MNIAPKGTTRVSPYKMGQILISDAISSSISHAYEESHRLESGRSAGRSCLLIHLLSRLNKFGYYMAEYVFAMQLVILAHFAVRNVLYGPKFQRKCSFRSSKSLYLGKKG